MYTDEAPSREAAYTVFLPLDPHARGRLHCPRPTATANKETHKRNETKKRTQQCLAVSPAPADTKRRQIAYRPSTPTAFG